MLIIGLDGRISCYSYLGTWVTDLLDPSKNRFYVLSVVNTTRLVAVSEGGRLHVWDALITPDQSSGSMASPRGGNSKIGFKRVYEKSTSHVPMVKCAASPGQYCADLWTCDTMGMILVWDANTFEVVQTMNYGESDGITSILAVKELVWVGFASGVIRLVNQ